MANENQEISETKRPFNSTPYSNSGLVDLKLSSRSFTKGRRGVSDGQNAITNITIHIVNGDWREGGFTTFAQSQSASSNYGITTSGKIVQLVDEKNTPWTNGVRDGIPLTNPFGKGSVGSSNNSVTIEVSNLRVNERTGPNTFVATDGKEYNFKVENGQTLIKMNGKYYERPITNEALDSTIRLVADIAKRNNLGELYHDGYKGTLTWHRDFSSGYVMCPGDYIMAMTDYICESANSINERGYYIPDYTVEGSDALMGIILSTESNPFDSGTVAADMYSTVSSINSIRNKIGVVDVQTPTYTSTSTIPGNLMNAESSLLGISNDLNGTILNETKVISSIAQVFFDMDRERTAAASALSDGSELTFDESGYTSMLNDILAFDVTSELKFESFMFDPFSHTEGNSGKICLSDLNSMLSGGSLSGPLHDNLESERQTARATLTEIDNLNTMITSGTNFKGDIWKAVSGRLTEYSELMTTRIESADILEEAMVKSLTLIKDYMGDYEELDDSKLPELREQIEQIKQAIMDAQNIIDATHTVTKSYEDSNGKTVYYSVTEYIYSASARRTAKNYITQATGTLREIEEEIVKLEGLPIILAQAEQIVNDALSQIYNNYGVKVSNVVCGKEVSYIPPSNTSYTAPELPKHNPWNYNKDIPEGKHNLGQFYMNPDLVRKYGSYDDYLNGVEKENNPFYNEDMEDNGIEPGDSLDDKIFENDEVEVPEDVTPEDENEPNEETEVPETDKPVEVPQQKPSTPQNPTQPTPQRPNSPSQPSTPNTPSQPSEPSTPSQPSEPSTPSQPSEPSTPGQPNEPSTPSQPSEPSTPIQPSEPSTPIQPSEPSTPSQPSEPSTPSQPSEPNIPSSPTIPVIPEDNGEAGYPNTPIIPDEVYPENGDLSIGDNIGNNDMIQDIPPIVEIPENNNDGNGLVDITPPGNTDTPSTTDRSGDLLKTIGIISGVGAAVGAAALGAHTISKAKKNDMYEDD